jgi:hypothetical protein
MQIRQDGLPPNLLGLELFPNQAASTNGIALYRPVVWQDQQSRFPLGILHAVSKVHTGA